MASEWKISFSKNTMLLWVTAVLVGLLPAFWTVWRLSTTRPGVTDYDTDMVSSNRRSWTATKLRFRTTGSTLTLGSSHVTISLSTFSSSELSTDGSEYLATYATFNSLTNPGTRMARSTTHGKAARLFRRLHTISQFQVIRQQRPTICVSGAAKLQVASLTSRSSTPASMRALLLISSEPRRSLQFYTPTTT